MHRLFVTTAFQEEAARCPTCELLERLDAALIHLDAQRINYGRHLIEMIILLAMQQHGDLSRRAASVHEELMRFVDLWRDALEVDRAGYGYNLFLYFTTEEFDGLKNRLRKGVQAHDQSVEKAKELRREVELAFATFSTAHGALAEACGIVSFNANALNSSFQPLQEAWAEAVELSGAFWRQLEPWMVARRKAAFTVLRPSSES
jgi:hypothetical protein